MLRHGKLECLSVPEFFLSRPAGVAQLVEHLITDPKVEGLIPASAWHKEKDGV